MEQKEIEIKQCVVVVLRNFMATGVTRVIACGYWCFFFSFQSIPFFSFPILFALLHFEEKILPTTIILFNRQQQQHNVDKIMQIGWLALAQQPQQSTRPARLMCSCLLCTYNVRPILMLAGAAAAGGTAASKPEAIKIQ